ncbi:MAG: N-acetylmuramoyl-L-alanine amidase [Bacteroidota bacterium]
MHHKKIPHLESNYRNGSTNRFTLQSFAIPIPQDGEELKGFTCRPSAGHNSYYYGGKYQKEKIVLHHTVGHLASDLRALTKRDYHVSVAFVIARDGTIYQLFSSAYWSYHLGRNALGGNKMQSKKSIGIELSNYGYLVPQGDNLETYYSRRKGNPVDVYCSKEDTDQYIELDQPYRGHRYYATFTDAQYQSLIHLLRYLTETYNIPRTFLPKEERYETTQSVINFNGIVSHVNFRKDKYDIGPALDWERIINGVQHKGVANLTLEAATKAYAAAEANYQKLQLEVWNIGGEGEDPALDEALEKAGKTLVQTCLQLEKVKEKPTSRGVGTITSRSLNIAFTSETETEEAYPYVRSRDIIDYGIDGPKEIERDELEWIKEYKEDK